MVDFIADRAALADFFENFVAPADDDAFGELVPIYKERLQKIANRQESVFAVRLDDLVEYQGGDTALADRIEKNTLQYLDLAAEASDAAMPEPTEEELPEDVFDVLLEQRKRARALTEAQRVRELGVGAGIEPPPGSALASDPEEELPAALTRRHEVLLEPREAQRDLPLRRVGAREVGHLVSFRGTVTQVTAVRPLLTIATYLDDLTGFEVYQEVTGKTFTPLTDAPAAVRAMHGGKSDLHLQSRGSRFVRYQEARVQERSEEVPAGSTPRTLTLQLRGSLARTIKAGDAVRVAGVLVPEPARGGGGGRGGAGAAPGASLLASLHVRALHVKRAKSSYADLEATKAQARAVRRLQGRGDAYARLARSVAPEIWGHEDVKRALLAALAGGVARTLPDGMRIRGDVHVCLMGDPGVAKSQLLRSVASLCPRSVYTTGRGSSGVGLTAAVLRDPTTNELVLEGGALVLADRGIACIDEFDKMEEGDRTALHEVMEQQTVSIAKAGITTTLNTRAAVLAAANPAYGRYDTSRSPAENINLPAALLSRFDILFLILDRPDRELDLALARHVVSVHRHGSAPGDKGRPGDADLGEAAAVDPLDPSYCPPLDPAKYPEDHYDSLVDDDAAFLPPDLLRAYLAEARAHEPAVPEELADYLAAVYAEVRREEAESSQPHSYTTARTLLSFLRLSQALARLRFADRVERGDVDEALRLLRASKASLADPAQRGRPQDPVSAAFSRIKQHAMRTGTASYTWAQLLELLGTTFKPQHIRQCLHGYAAINIWKLSDADSQEPGIEHIDGVLE